MARPVRIEYQGAAYHVAARGNDRREIFRDDADRKQFLSTLARAVEEHGLQVHGYCLMPNHYHLLIRTPRGNLSQSIGWLQTTYTIRFNRRHDRRGHLFQGRFKAHLVEAQRYAAELLRHLHLIPVRPHDQTAAVPRERWVALDDYPWSSHRFYDGDKPAPAWLSMEWLELFGGDPDQARKGYREFIQDGFENGTRDIFADLYRGLILGSEAMRNRVLERLEEKPGQDEQKPRHPIRHDRAVGAVTALAAKEDDVRWKAWLRVYHGGERKTDVARSLGYRDGSAITHLLKRFEKCLSGDKALQGKAAALIHSLESSNG